MENSEQQPIVQPGSQSRDVSVETPCRPPAVTLLGIILMLVAIPELLGIYGFYLHQPLHTISAIYSVLFVAVSPLIGMSVLRLLPWARLGAIVLLVSRYLFISVFFVIEQLFPISGEGAAEYMHMPIWAYGLAGILTVLNSILFLTALYLLLLNQDVKEAFGQRG